jgi:ABC-type antimicrobial peptide transport system, permease component
MLAIKELLNSKLKFGLIALAIGLVVSLTMLMAAMSEGLISGMTGAKEALQADVLVFQGDTQLSLERSLLSAADLEQIRKTPGVKEVYAVGHAMASVETDAGSFDARVLGLGGHFEQLPIVEGAGDPLGRGEAIVDVTAKAEGVSIGDTVRLSPIDRELTVVGFTEGRRYVMSPTFYVDMATWEDLYLASALAPVEKTSGDGADPVRDQFSGSASIAAVTLTGAHDAAAIEALAATLGSRFEVTTPAKAAMAGNGMSVMVLAVDGIQVVSLVIGALVIGVFFYVTTLNKTGQIAAIKALGASNGYVSGQLILQITILVAAAAAIGIALALALGSAMPPAMAFEPRPQSWLISLVAVFFMAYLGSLFSLRAILAIDPASALNQTEH